jgi:hypothetical protein
MRRAERGGARLRAAWLAPAALLLATGAGTQPSLSQDTLVGVSWNDSTLLSFDPAAGAIVQRHLQLNPYEAFAALAYDPNHHRLFALAQSTQNLYAIDTRTLEIAHAGNLRIDKRFPGLVDAVSLAYDRGSDTLFSVVGRWQAYPSGPISGDLSRVDPATAEVTAIGTISGPWITSLAFSDTEGDLYGSGVFGAGSWDSPFKTHIFAIDPTDAALTPLFETPYHTVLGLALKEPSTFFSWINWTSHFYGEIDLASQIVRPLGSSDAVGVLYAMEFKEFEMPPFTAEIAPAPASFVYGGVITSVRDPDDVLLGRVAEGNRFTGEFRYDASSPYRLPDPNAGAPSGISLRVNGLAFSAAGLDAAVVNNFYDSFNGTLADEFGLDALTPANELISWHLIDHTARSLANNQTLPTRFDLAGWDGNTLLLGSFDPQGEYLRYQIVGAVDFVFRRRAQRVRRSVR